MIPLALAATDSTPVKEPAAPNPCDFPEFPEGWYFFCHIDELRKGPVRRDFGGRGVVAYQAASGRVAAMDARCSHLGADLSAGEVRAECLRCPFHHWEYRLDGQCARIPAQEEIPAFARQRTYPTQRIGPYLFIYTARQPAYELPFFSGELAADFTPSKPYLFTLNCPWYFVGANGFDSQHFACAHDRVIEAGPDIDAPAPHARRSSSRFRVAGTSWQDAFTRLVSGRTVTITHTDYSGTLIFATARFRRTTSYGMLSVQPLEASQTRVTLVVWIRRNRTALGRAILDPLHLSLRRYFVTKFLAADVDMLQGCTYHPRRLIAADARMADYLAWLAAIYGPARAGVSLTAEDAFV